MKRRQILKVLTAVGAWTVVAGSPLALLVRRSCAALRRRLLPADTYLGTLLFEKIGVRSQHFTVGVLLMPSRNQSIGFC